jgi:formylglycine-generating enzyme required for sulfatase activity
MKTIRLFIAVVFTALAVVSHAGGSYVTNLVIRQNWPWNGRVSIDFTLVGDGTSSLSMIATHDGGTIDLSAGGLDSVPLVVSPGDCHFEWDPAKAGFGLPLRNFSVSVVPVSVDDHTYIAFDLVTGTRESFAEVPSGGWPLEYRTTKMVFRRIPAATFTMGIDLGEYMTYVGYTSDREAAHTVTLSSDFYMAVYPLTVAQYNTLKNSGAVTSECVKNVSYNEMRGSASAGVNWPLTGYEVADSSLVNLVRTRFGGMYRVDLPTEAQWEWAARCGASGVWYATEDFPGGGTKAELGAWGSEACTNLVSSIAVWQGNGNTTTAVGGRLPNRFGLYDCSGMMAEWCLDQGNTSRLSDAVDPVGVAAATSDNAASRQRRGGPSYGTFGQDITLVRRYYATADNTTFCGVRFCIHLNPLVH